MGRRRSSLGEDLVRAFALLPWWLCVILAVVAYYWLGHIAGQPLPPPKPGDPTSLIPRARREGAGHEWAVHPAGPPADCRRAVGSRAVESQARGGRMAVPEGAKGQRRATTGPPHSHFEDPTGDSITAPCAGPIGCAARLPRLRVRDGDSESPQGAYRWAGLLGLRELPAVQGDEGSAVSDRHAAIDTGQYFLMSRVDAIVP